MPAVTCRCGCGKDLPDDWWRWACPSCGHVVRYAHVPGGVPVSATPTCPHDSTPLEAHRDAAAHHQASTAGKLF